MSELMSRSFVLTLSRVSNFAILILSPLLLVRILDVEGYGQYQEFMIYATLLVMICGFGVDASLTYFLPRYPDRERLYVTQNSLLVLVASTVCLSLLYLAKTPFLQIISIDFVSPLAFYVFCFVNLNWLEYFWIAKRRTDLVLYYTVARLAIRIGVLLAVAYLTRDLMIILWSLVAVEAFRLVAVTAYLLRASLFTTELEIATIKEQVSFAGPVGLARLMQQLSRNIGKLFVGSALGPAALAYYAVASYLLPMVQVIRGSIAEVVFPELVRARNNPQNALRLWQRTNIVFCLLLFPLFVLLTWYGELFITTLFTADYRPAVPVFQVYILWILRRCFNTDSLLRTKGKTGFMFIGTGVAVATNILLMVAFYWLFGLIGPAIAYIVAETLLEGYYLIIAKKEFQLKFKTLIDWGGVWRVGAACIMALPVLLLAGFVPAPDLARAIVASGIYAMLCWLVAYHLGLNDVKRILLFALSWRERLSQVRRDTSR